MSEQVKEKMTRDEAKQVAAQELVNAGGALEFAEKLWAKGAEVYGKPAAATMFPGVGNASGGGVAQMRRTVFTRNEVLTVIRARAAMIDVSAGTDAAFAAQLGVLADLLRMFERME